MLSTSPPRISTTHLSQNADATGTVEAPPVLHKGSFQSFTFQMEQIGASRQGPRAKTSTTTSDAEGPGMIVDLDQDSPHAHFVQSADPPLVDHPCINVALPSLAPTPFIQNNCIEAMTSHSPIHNPSPVHPVTESPGEDDGSCKLPPEEEVTCPNSKSGTELYADVYRRCVVDF